MNCRVKYRLAFNTTKKCPVKNLVKHRGKDRHASVFFHIIEYTYSSKRLRPKGFDSNLVRHRQ